MAVRAGAAWNYLALARREQQASWQEMLHSGGPSGSPGLGADVTPDEGLALPLKISSLQAPHAVRPSAVVHTVPACLRRRPTRPTDHALALRIPVAPLRPGRWTPPVETGSMSTQHHEAGRSISPSPHGAMSERSTWRLPAPRGSGVRSARPSAPESVSCRCCQEDAKWLPAPTLCASLTG